MARRVTRGQSVWAYLCALYLGFAVGMAFVGAWLWAAGDAAIAAFALWKARQQ